MLDDKIDMILGNKIFGVYVYLEKKPPRRFVIKRRKLHPLRDIFEIYKPRTLCDFVLELFTILDKTHPNFMRNISEQDKAQFQKGISKRRFVAEKRDDLIQFNNYASKPSSKPFLNYWVVSNLYEKDVKKIVDIACNVAKVKCESLSNLHL